MAHHASAFCSFIAAILVLGCNSIPEGRMSVNEIQVRGADKVDEDEIKDKIATSESKKFMGLFRGVVFEYSTLDRFVLQRDLARVEAVYRSKGYYDAHARAGRVHQIDDTHVRVEIVVEEGEPSLVRKLRIDGVEGLPAPIVEAAKLAAGGGLPVQKPLEQEKLDVTEGNIRRALSDRGYAHAKVKADAAVDLVTHRADVVFTVTPGPICTVGPVRIEGLGDLPEKPVRRALDLDEGEPYSELVLENAQQALLDLGVFAGVEIKPEVPDGATELPVVVPIVVKLEPTRLKTIKLGGGVELDALKTDIHGIVGWEHRNFLGGLRTFQIAFRPGVVLYPIRVNNFVAPEAFLPGERLRIDFKQPGLFEARTNGFIRPEFNVQPVLLNPDPPPDARVLGYAELRNSVGLERTMWKLYAAISHNTQFAYPFGYIGPKDPTLGTILISYPELLTTLDFRDDKVHPTKGIFLGNTLQVAGLGGDARDVKIQPEVRGYVPLHRRVVWATRASVGFLMPSNYGDVVRTHPSTFDAPSEARTRDYQVTFFRGFFSGGPTSNRGYPIRGVGPYDVVPFLNPSSELGRVNAGCGAGDSSDRCRSPTGGFTLWEASTELRIILSGPLSVATFCDASDVSPRVADLRFDHLHLSCGAGGRYDTPVGPIRLDVGYRIPGLQVIGGLTPDERAPTDILGIPIAIHIGIGEAF